MKRIWAPWRMPYLRATTSGDDDEGCLFCAMRDADDDGQYHVLYRGERVFVTLNRYPYSNGHLMVVPNSHVSNLEALDEATLAELMAVTRRCVEVLREAYDPQGFNVGINIGSAAGAGLADHLHQHVVPRWAGDTNFMTTLGETRVIPEWMDDTYAELRAVWQKKFPNQKSG
jgi:ATP adenylyltransferase